MQLDAIHAGRHHPLQREQMIALVFSRQPDDQMAAHLQPALPGPLRGLLIAAEIMAAVDAFERFIVRRLQPQLQPHFITLLAIPRQQIQCGGRHAVRPGTDAQADHLALRQRLPIHRRQQFDLRIGAGIGTEIGQIAPRPVDPRGLLRQLFSDTLPLHRLIGERSDVAKRTAAAPQRAVAVRAAESAVQREFMDLFAIAALEICAKHID